MSRSYLRLSRAYFSKDYLGVLSMYLVLLILYERLFKDHCPFNDYIKE